MAAYRPRGREKSTCCSSPGPVRAACRGAADGLRAGTAISTKPQNSLTRGNAWIARVSKATSVFLPCLRRTPRNGRSQPGSGGSSREQKRNGSNALDLIRRILGSNQQSFHDRLVAGFFSDAIRRDGVTAAAMEEPNQQDAGHDEWHLAHRVCFRGGRDRLSRALSLSATPRPQRAAVAAGGLANFESSTATARTFCIAQVNSRLRVCEITHAKGTFLPLTSRKSL